MFMCNSLQPGSFRRDFARNVFSLCFLFCLSAALLLTGCPADPDPHEPELFFQLPANSPLIGTWQDDWGFGYMWDGFRITRTTLVYYSNYGFDSDDITGTIEAYSKFSESAGVIIIKITSTNPDNYVEEIPGTYLGIYYEKLVPDTSVDMSVASLYPAGLAGVSSLNAAINTFTLGNEGDYIGGYPTYLKK